MAFSALNGTGLKMITYDKDAEKAIEEFKNDYYLFNCLTDDFALDGVKDRGNFDADALKIWKSKAFDGIPHNSFMPYFSLFRYNLPAIREEVTQQDEKATQQNNNNLSYKWRDEKKIEGLTKEKRPLKLLDDRVNAILKLKENICGEESIRSHMTVFFILIASAIWMGLLPACKEIVSDWNVFLRESRNNVSTVAFLLSKFTMLNIMTTIQNVVFVLLTGVFWQKIPLLHCLAIFVILLVTSNCAIAVGLLISSFTTNIRQGLMIIPMIMVAQLILGGLLRLPAQTRDEGKMKIARSWAGKATLQYWAFEAMTGFIARLPEPDEKCPTDTKILLRRDIVVFKKPESAVAIDKQTLLNFMKSKIMRVDDYIFGTGEPPCYLKKMKDKKMQDKWGICETEDDWKSFIYHVIRPLSYIILANIVLLLVTIVLLKAKLVITRNGGLLAMILRI